MHDLAIIIVAYNDERWVRAMLPTVFEHMGDVVVDVVVVDNDSDDGVLEMVASEFPRVRTLRSANHGFGYGNNRGLMTCDARYVLFLNPDTEILDGSFAELVEMMDARPTVGLVGCRQITGAGRLDTTIRYFPSAVRAFAEAVGAERVIRRRPSWLGEREADVAVYEREFECDWTSGSFLLARREALLSAGCFDERYFMYSEETDLCRRIKTAGWSIRHFPNMTILHHDGKAGVRPEMESLAATSKMIYAHKFFSQGHRSLYRCALLLRHGIRSVYSGGGHLGAQKREANRHVVATLLGRHSVPFASITNPVSLAPLVLQRETAAVSFEAPDTVSPAGEASPATAGAQLPDGERRVRPASPGPTT